jgi:lathosterol oxidase
VPVQEWVQARPVILQFIGCVFIADLCQYVIHRWYHRNRYLWRFHSIHHSSQSLDWLAGSRMHLVEIFVTRTVVVVPLYLIGFSEGALNAYVVLVGTQAVLVHANVGWNFGIFEYVLVTPRYHHWHHSRDVEFRDRNYAVHLPVIDMLFGTWRMPKGRWPDAFGILGDPVSKGFWKQLTYPFRR